MVVLTRGVYTFKVPDTGVVVELVLHVWGGLECNGQVLLSVKEEMSVDIYGVT